MATFKVFWMRTCAGEPPAANRLQKKMATMNSGAAVGSDVLRVKFERAGDRFAHRIFWSVPDGSRGVLISQNGGPQETWPASPALQSLHTETRPGGGLAAMLVGMAGRSHWSMSVEADGAGNRLLFDVACRVQERPGWLGNTYLMSFENGNVWSPGGLLLTAWHGDAVRKEIAVQIDSASVRIPAAASAEDYPQTIRWRYAIEITK
jgi:hypothetical protein